MIEYFGIFAMGILVGILGTLMILRGLRGEFLNTEEDIDIDEEEFEELRELFSHDETFIPEEEKIKLPDESGLRIVSGYDIAEHEKEMEELFNGTESN